MSSKIGRKFGKVADIGDFDTQSGSIVERILFNYRFFILLLCTVITVALGFEATHLKLNASYTKMIPTHQPMISNYLAHYDELRSQGNSVRIVVQANKGTIIDSHYLQVLENISDQVYLLPNVDRADMSSLWTSSTRWLGVTSDGLAAGPVMGQGYDGSAAQLAIVQQNIYRTGRVGELVSNDFTSSSINVPLLDYDGLTGKPINYGVLAREMNQIRKQYADRGVTLRIVGFAMVVGDMINGITKILAFFGVSVVIAASVLFWYTRCLRSTLLVVTASLIAVVWQMGALPFLGYDLTPYSVLVPFLVFAIGMSHGAQKMNGIMQDIGRGIHPFVAARFTFRRLFLAGFAALVCDAASFAVLMIIHIDAIRELASIASIGVGILIFTNLMMLPLALSYTGVNKAAAARSLKSENLADGQSGNPVWKFLDLFTTRRYATITVFCAVVIGALGLFVGRNIQVGDLHQGAPELRQDSQYNVDNAYIINHYSTSSDTMIVLADTAEGGCLQYSLLYAESSLAWRVSQLPEVQSTSSIAQFVQNGTMLLTEDSPKWDALTANQGTLGSFNDRVPFTLTNFDCNFAPVYISLNDHKAATLTTVLSTIQNFISDPDNKSPTFKLSLVGGNAGIAAATNIVVEQSNKIMLVSIYVVVLIFCFIVFRSWRAVLCAAIPLALTSVLAQALMVSLAIGTTVATLPVIALDVGIGVDYAIYVLGIIMKHLRAGETLSEAYYRTLLFTGKVVLLTGFTLGAGVVSWVFAPIKFQADMGLLLSCMFLWNMLGALILLPALAYFLLPPRLFVQHAAESKLRPSSPQTISSKNIDAQRMVHHEDH